MPDLNLTLNAEQVTNLMGYMPLAAQMPDSGIVYSGGVLFVPAVYEAAALAANPNLPNPAIQATKDAALEAERMEYYNWLKAKLIADGNWHGGKGNGNGNGNGNGSHFIRTGIVLGWHFHLWACRLSCGFAALNRRLEGAARIRWDCCGRHARLVGELFASQARLAERAARDRLYFGRFRADACQAVLSNFRDAHGGGGGLVLGLGRILRASHRAGDR